MALLRMWHVRAVASRLSRTTAAAREDFGRPLRLRTLLGRGCKLVLCLGDGWSSVQNGNRRNNVIGDKSQFASINGCYCTSAPNNTSSQAEVLVAGREANATAFTDKVKITEQGVQVRPQRTRMYTERV